MNAKSCCRFFGCRDRVFILWALALGGLLHGSFAWASSHYGWDHWNIDEVNVARRVLNGRGFSFDYYGLFEDGLREGAFFPPGYVYNCVALLWTFGTTKALLIQNVVFTLATSYGLYLLGSLLLTRQVGRVALVLSLVYPPLFVRVGHGSPVYFKMFFMVALMLAVQYVWMYGRGAIVAGVLAGLLALAMPDVLLYVVMIGGAIVLRDRFELRSLRTCCVMGAVTALTVLPWTLRTYIRFHETCLVSTNGGFNFYMGNCPNSNGEVDYGLVKDLDRQLDGALAATDEFGRDHILYREGVAYMWAHPWQAAGRTLQKALTHWFFRPENRRALASGLRSGEFSESFVFYMWIYCVSYVLLALAATLGILHCRRDLPRMTPLLLACLYSTLVASLFVVQTKMRLIKAEPVLIVFAAAWLCHGNTLLASAWSRAVRGNCRVTPTL